MSDSHHHTPSRWPAIVGIAILLALYAATIFQWGPNSLSIHHGDHDEHAAEMHGADEHGGHEEHAEDHDGGDSHDGDHGGAHGEIPHYYAVIPFILLLGAIAILPLLSATEHFDQALALNRFLNHTGDSPHRVLYTEVKFAKSRTDHCNDHRYQRTK